MTCYRPNIRVANFNQLTEKGNSSTYKFINSLGDQIKRYPNGEVNYEWYEKQNEIIKERGFEYQQVPCGKCIGCKESYRKEWATRLVLESQRWKDNYFVTLTYDDEHLPWDDTFINQETGEIYEDDGTWNGYLVPDHMTKFLKRLRRNLEYDQNFQGVRYFYCGEYGTTYKRPHYHIILFNCPLDTKDFKVRRIDAESGKILWNSAKLEKLWGMGFVTIEEFDYNAAAYVAGYVQKKAYSCRDTENYAKRGQTPEFVRMSRKEGIGKYYYEHHPEMYQNDEIIIKGSKQKIIPAKIPRYFDKQRELVNPEQMEKLKLHRKNKAIINQNTKMSQTDLCKAEQLKVEECAKERIMNTLKRNRTEVG